ncbi:MAG: mechanosensitive ion channel [Deltaproteobacteria bacterium]|nr:mechanosensitive ion channel [Deltaproteobacteria bacterium]
MQRNLHPDGLSVTASALALALGLISVPSARAQDAEPKPEVPAPEEPKEITSADFAIQANAVEDRLSQIQNEMSVIDVAEDVNAALDEIEAEGAELRKQVNALESRRMMISELNALHTQLEFLDARTKRQIAKLSEYAGDLEELETQNEEDIEVWTRAVRAIRKPSIPKPVRDRTASILHGLREGQKELAKKLSEVLALQSRALDVRDSVHLAEQSVMLAQRQQAQSIFERQDPPLWSTGPRPAEETERDGYEIGFSWLAVTSYLRAERGMLLLRLFLVLALGWAFVRARALLAARIEKHQQDGGIPWEDRAFEALRHPWAAALLLAIASVRFFYPDRVAEIIVLTWVVALPLWFVVYKEMVPATFRNALVGLGLLGTIHVVVTMVSGHPDIERALLLLELVLVSAGAGWLIRFLRNVDVPKRMRQGLWFVLAGLWTRIALLISIVGVGATVFGYAYLAAEAAMITIIGTLGATVWMALERIVEAIVSTAVHEGRLDGFRMIRANRDVTTKVMSRVARLTAVVLFMWSLADMTSAWRPVARVIGRVLSADLGFGLATTGVTLGDLGAFFIILWLSWIIARFVSFVLREELLPRLHVKQGVPFALTTFTRYAIIAFGFIAAVSVLGIPLDRLTIVRPIRLRDKIEIEGVLGHVSDIGIRASTIRTFDGAEVIVPNGDLISGRVVNWTLSARQQRVTIPVGVAYGTDPNQVLAILRKLAADNEKVLKTPAPLALFRGFGESSLDFELRIFMDPADVLDVPSDVTIAISEALKEAEIEIPFPQRDLHLRGVPKGFALTDAGT